MSRNIHEKATKSDARLLLGDFEFSLQSNELTDQKGNPVHLRRQSTDVLAYLVQRAGELVSKSELIENLWRDTFVTDDSLVQCIADIRRALNDDDHKIVQTLPKKGYKLSAVHLFDEPIDPSRDAEGPNLDGRRRNGISTPLAMVAVAMLALGILIWALFRSDSGREVAHLPLPGKPSIAVLAFDNLTGGVTQDYLSDGLSENITTALARFPDFFVIARNSSFTYKGKPTKVQQIAAELGVRYVIEGSVQFADETFRTTAQLIDASTGKHLWAETYDREMTDFFDVQDDITQQIASTLVANISQAEYNRLKNQPTQNLGAYELFKRAQEQSFTFTKEGNIRALALAEQARALDPNFTSAYIELAWAHINGARWGWSENTPRDTSLKLAFDTARKAIELEPLNFKAHWVLANATTQSGDLKGASVLYDKAISLNPNSASVLADSIDPLVYSGRAEEGVARMKAAIRLNPHHQDWYLWNLGWAQYFAQDYEDALASIEKMNEVPNQLKRTLAPILLRLGREDEARVVIGEFLESNPTYDIQEASSAPFTDQNYLNHWLDDLRKLGVPEHAP